MQLNDQPANDSKKVERYVFYFKQAEEFQWKQRLGAMTKLFVILAVVNCGFVVFHDRGIAAYDNYWFKAILLLPMPTIFLLLHFFLRRYYIGRAKRELGAIECHNTRLHTSMDYPIDKL